LYTHAGGGVSHVLNQLSVQFIAAMATKSNKSKSRKGSKRKAASAVDVDSTLLLSIELAGGGLHFRGEQTILDHLNDDDIRHVLSRLLQLHNPKLTITQPVQFPAASEQSSNSTAPRSASPPPNKTVETLSSHLNLLRSQLGALNATDRASCDTHDGHGDDPSE
jgi:hypothetical protein